MLYEDFSFSLGFGGVPPSVWSSGGHQHMGCPSAQSSTTATTTTPVMVVSSGLSLVSSVTVAPSLTGFPVSLDQCGEVQPPPRMPRGSGGVIGSASLPQQQPPSLMPLLAYANYAMGSPQVGFFFRVEPPTLLLLYVWCPFWCLLFTFGYQVGCCIYLVGLNH